MVMFSQTMSVVGQTHKRIQVCDLSSHLRSLIFYGCCYTWKAWKRSQREGGKWGWGNPWWLCLCFLVLPALCVKPLWTELWSGLIQPGCLCTGIYREWGDGNVGQVFTHTPFYAQHQGTEYLWLLLTMKQLWDFLNRFEIICNHCSQH